MTWIGERLAAGSLGRDDVNQHIMNVYAEPLKIYYLGSSFRTLGDADDMVQGFFASRLDQDQFFDNWQQSGMRLRRWLMNGFLFYLREQIRSRKRDGRIGAMPEQPPAEPDDAGAAELMDRAWAESIVRRAYADGADACREAGQSAHWDIFVQHHLHGRSYQDIVGGTDVTPAQAVVMARTATMKFRNALRESIRRDGVATGAIDDEIQQLMEAMK